MSIHKNTRPQVALEGVRYPDPDRLTDYLERGVLTRETLAEAFDQSFRENADRTALAGPEGHLSYRELDDRATRLAAALLKLGVKPLDRAIFQCGNSNQLLIAFFACLKATIIPVCSLQAFRKHEVDYLGNLAEATLHIVQGDDPKFDDVAFAQEMRQEVPSLAFTLQLRGHTRNGARSLSDLIDNMPFAQAQSVLSDITYDPFQVAVFQLSGGTTGVPKIIPRFQNEYLYNMRAVAACNAYHKDEVLFFPTPFLHNLNMGCYFGPFLLVGATVTVAPDITEQTLQRLVRDYQPTWFGVAGPILQRVAPELVKADEATKARRKFVAPKNAPRLRKVTGSPVYHIFGMTEGVIMFTRPGDAPHLLDQSVGRPVSIEDEIRLVYPGTEKEVAAGEVGEALFRGPYTIRGYYKSEAEDVHRFTPDGFYRSGDLMRYEEHAGQRNYFFCGRIKDVVDRGGEKINAEEVEGVINRHPSVLACAVVGMPDRVYGERVCGFVTLQKHVNSLSLDELKQFLEDEGLAKFKWPERIEVVKEFPLTPSGKLSKKILREEIAERVENEASAPPTAGAK